MLSTNDISINSNMPLSRAAVIACSYGRLKKTMHPDVNLIRMVFCRFLVTLLLLAFSAPGAMAQPSLKSQEVWPAVDAYYLFNPHFRLYATVAGTKKEESSYSDAAIGLFADYFTFPVAKKLHPKSSRSDSLPGKYLWLRGGYQYSATPPSAEDPFEESMIVTEANARYYLPYGMLLSMKNRFDWRFNSGDFNARYRPRLTLERDMKTEFLTFTASGFAEYYINFGSPSVNRLKTQLGVEIRVFKRINYEIFWNHQYANEPEIAEVDAFGMTLKIYMDKNAKIFKLGKKKSK
jgi:hypothetical protein